LWYALRVNVFFLVEQAVNSIKEAAIKRKVNRWFKNFAVKDMLVYSSNK